MPEIVPKGALSIETLRGMRGKLIGEATIADCVSAHPSPWFFGPWGFVLERPRLFETPIACAGALMFFTVPESARAELAATEYLERIAA